MPHRDITKAAVDESARLVTIADYDLELSRPEAEFDHLVELASLLFNVPISLISIVESEHQFFKARVGLDVCSTSREVSFCRFALDQTEPLIVEDASLDPRFRENPLVLGPPFIRFYAGARLLTESAYALGTLCIIDDKPREFSANQALMLKKLARLVMDRFELRRSERKLRASQQRFERMTQSAASALVCADSQGRITFFNRAAEKMFGASEADSLGQPFIDLFPGMQQAIIQNEIERQRRQADPDSIGRLLEMKAQRQSGENFPIKIGLSTWSDTDGPNCGAFIIDITQRIAAQQRLQNLAHIDQLTGLPSRERFFQLADQALRMAGHAALLLLDLDGFKDINDTLGHSAGDRLLQNVARRVTRAIGSERGILGRLGGDEFVLFAPMANGASDATAIATTIIDQFKDDFSIDGDACHLNTSIGIAQSPGDGETIEALLASADMALYRAKASGGGTSEIFTADLKMQAESRRTMQTELRQAFDDQQFELFWQPQVDMRTNGTVGAEVLLRWRHPILGLRSPGEFLPVLDKMLLANEVGEWAIRTALAQLATWDARGLPRIHVGVNLFELQFRSGTLALKIIAELAKHNIAQGRLELEVTETTAIKSEQAVLLELTALRQAGVGVAFDDFGTGYASLSLLKRFPLSRLKVDQTFVRDMTADRADAAIVESVLKLGTAFGLDVIAEGVETEEQACALRKLGCNAGQGYLYGRPMTVREFEQHLLRPRRDAADGVRAMRSVG